MVRVLLFLAVTVLEVGGLTKLGLFGSTSFDVYGAFLHMTYTCSCAQFPTRAHQKVSQCSSQRGPGFVLWTMCGGLALHPAGGIGAVCDVEGLWVRRDPPRGTNRSSLPIITWPLISNPSLINPVLNIPHISDSSRDTDSAISN